VVHTDDEKEVAAEMALPENFTSSCEQFSIALASYQNPD